MKDCDNRTPTKLNNIYVIQERPRIPRNPGSRTSIRVRTVEQAEDKDTLDLARGRREAPTPLQLLPTAVKTGMVRQP